MYCSFLFCIFYLFLVCHLIHKVSISEIPWHGEPIIGKICTSAVVSCLSSAWSVTPLLLVETAWFTLFHCPAFHLKCYTPGRLIMWSTNSFFFLVDLFQTTIDDNLSHTEPSVQVRHSCFQLFAASEAKQGRSSPRFSFSPSGRCCQGPQRFVSAVLCQSRRDGNRWNTR